MIFSGEPEGPAPVEARFRAGRSGSTTAGKPAFGAAAGRKIGWLVKRLRVMTPAEVVHRAGAQCALFAMSIRHRMGNVVDPIPSPPDSFAFCAGTARLPDLPWAFDAGEDSIEDLLSGKSKALGFDWAWTPEGAAWDTAPDTQRSWPKIFFGRISYRPGNRIGDIRVAWEPSRLQHLVALGLLAKGADAKRAGRAADLLEAQLLSWVAANPFLTGIHYISAMECALRILAVCHALDLAREKIGRPEEVWRAVLALVKGHAGLIARRISRHSSAGNHTIAEAAGLVYAGTLFQEIEEAKKWRETGLRLLEQEAERQVLEDGGGAEQAFWYQLFIVDLYGLVIALLDHRMETVPSPVRSAYQRGKDFLNRFADAPDRLPSIGDSDNGFALSPFLRLSFDPIGKAPRPETASFDLAGYTLIRRGGTSGPALIFDHGPLGMAPSYGHGHADALSVNLRLGAEEILIDPGTYLYNGGRWRSYFRGTAAHNTVAVDGKDQAVEESPFLWSSPFRAGLIHREELPEGTVRLLAFHDGYRRLGGIRHWRGVIAHPPGFYLIWDYLTGTGEHRLDLHWHLGAGPAAAMGQSLLRRAERNFRLSVEGGETSLRSGEAGEICGWRSRRYGVKEPITTVRTRFHGTLPHEFVTRIQVGEAARADFSSWDERHEISVLMKRIKEKGTDGKTEAD